MRLILAVFSHPLRGRRRRRICDITGKFEEVERSMQSAIKLFSDDFEKLHMENMSGILVLREALHRSLICEFQSPKHSSMIFQSSYFNPPTCPPSIAFSSFLVHQDPLHDFPVFVFQSTKTRSMSNSFSIFSPQDFLHEHPHLHFESLQPPSIIHHPSSSTPPSPPPYSSYSPVLIPPNPLHGQHLANFGPPTRTP